MRKLGIILMMIGFVLPVYAQLGFRTVNEKPLGDSTATYMTATLGAGIVIESSQTSNGTLLFSYSHKACLRCSTTVAHQATSLLAESKLKISQTLTCCDSYNPPIINNFFVDNGFGFGVTKIYDRNFEKIIESNWGIGKTLKSTPDGGILIGRSNRETMNQVDTLIRLNQQKQVIWRYVLQSSFLRPNATVATFEPSDAPYFWNNEQAYVSRNRILNENLQTISTQEKLVLVDENGNEKWTRTLDNSNSSYKIIGTDNENRLVVFAQKDSIGRLLKFNATGEPSGTITIKLPIVYTLTNNVFQSTNDGGFVFYSQDGQPRIHKFNSTGKQEWEYSLDRIKKVKVFPNGNSIIVTPPGTYKIAMLSSKGDVLFKEQYYNILETATGGMYATTINKLYSITNSGEVEWTVPYSASSAWVSMDNDGGLLLRETIVTGKNPLANNFLKGILQYDDNYTHRLSKYSKTGKLIWQAPLDYPVKDATKQVRFLGGIFPAGDGGYVVPSLQLTTLLSTATINQLGTNVVYQSYLLKITRPCYEKPDASLKASTTTLCTGQKLQLTSNTDSLGFLSYQWQRDGQSLSTTRNPAFETTGAGTYQVSVRDSVCETSTLSNAINVISRQVQLPAITNTGSTDFCAGSDFATLTAVSSNPELRYQWLRNGQALSGTFQSSIKVTEAGSYQLSALDAVCGATLLSTEVVVKVRPLPEAVVTPEVTGAVYAPFKAKLRANEGAGLTYQWFKEGTELTGATGAVYEAGESGNYSVRVSREGCSQLSQTLNITILQPLGVETGGTEEFKVFPNPSRGDFELNLPTGWEKAEIVLLDVMGCSVPMHRTGTHIRVEAAAGMYWLRAIVAEKEISKRLVVIP